MMQSVEPNRPSTSDSRTASITVTVQVANSTRSVTIDLVEYDFVKEHSSIDLIYNTVEQLTVELQRGI
jgi:hypothetical protein